MDKNVLKHINGKTSTLKLRANLTQREETEIEDAKNRPSSAYKRLSQALQISRKDQKEDTYMHNSQTNSRFYSTMKKGSTLNSKVNQLKEFCSWKCMKLWLRSNCSTQYIYQTELLIDLSAGYIVETE